MIGFDEFQDYLDKCYAQYELNFNKHILARIKDIAIDCFMASKESLNPTNRKNCFELFGYDFMIDEDFRVWLIEVNTNPAIGISNEKLVDVLPNMLKGLF